MYIVGVCTFQISQNRCAFCLFKNFSFNEMNVVRGAIHGKSGVCVCVCVYLYKTMCRQTKGGNSVI